MRPAHVSVGATGPSNWVPIDYLEAGFGIGYRCTAQEGASVTYKVQHGFLLGEPISLANLTRSSGTATATWRVGTDDYTASVGLQTGDCVLMGGYGAPFDGVFTVTVASGTSFTFTVANSGPTSSTTGLCQRVQVADDPIVVGATGSTEGNIAFPIWALRLNATAYVSGAVNMSIYQGIST
jgi:hypothetical protein